MAKADAEPRGPEVHIEQAIGRLYRFLAGNRYTRFPWAMIQTFSKAEGALLSGSMAYYTFLSLLPLLMVAAFVIATFASPEPEAQAAVAEALNQAFPGVGTDVFQDVIDQVVANSAALGVFGLLSVAYAGSGFVGSMTACMNRMWQVPSGRNPVGQKVVNILIVMMLGTVLLGSALLTIWVSATAQRTLELEATSPVISMIEELAGPTSMGIVLLLLYRFLPARKQSWLRQVPGAVFGGGRLLRAQARLRLLGQPVGRHRRPAPVAGLGDAAAGLARLLRPADPLRGRPQRGPGPPPPGRADLPRHAARAARLEMPAAPGPDASGPPLPSHREARAPPTFLNIVGWA